MKLTRFQGFFLGLGLAILGLAGYFYAFSSPAKDVETTPENVPVLDAVVVGDATPYTGKVVFFEQRGQPHYRVAIFDFKTQVISTVFQIPPRSLVYQLAATPQTDTLLMTYSTPPEEGQALYDRNAIYTLNITTGTFDYILGGEAENIYYTYPQWTDEGLYYVRSDRAQGRSQIERLDWQTETTEVIAESATLPIPSPDGEHLAYLALNPETLASSLWVGDAKGKNALELIAEDRFWDIDFPMFSEDGNWIYFTVIAGETSRPPSNFLDFALGVQRAEAHGNHNLPAFWYRVPVTGGEPEQITTDATVILSGASHDDMIAYISDTGLYMAHNQTVEQLIQSRAMRSLVWLSAEE